MIRSEIRKAAKPHRCEHCRGPIAKGERYRFSVASPDHDGLGNQGWWPAWVCLRCRPEVES